MLAELPPHGWDVDELLDFGDAVGIPLVEDFYDDAIGGRGAYPLPEGTPRIYAKEAKAVLLQFCPVLVPVLVVIVLVLIFG